MHVKNFCFGLNNKHIQLLKSLQYESASLNTLTGGILLFLFLVPSMLDASSALCHLNEFSVTLQRIGITALPQLYNKTTNNLIPHFRLTLSGVRHKFMTQKHELTKLNRKLNNKHLVFCIIYSNKDISTGKISLKNQSRSVNRHRMMRMLTEAASDCKQLLHIHLCVLAIYTAPDMYASPPNVRLHLQSRQRASACKD